MKSGSSVVSEINSCEFVQFVSKRKGAGRISPPGADSLGAELSAALPQGDRKADKRAICQVDMQRIGVACVQVGGGHVKVPHPTSIGKGSVRDIIVDGFVHVVHRDLNAP